MLKEYTIRIMGILMFVGAVALVFNVEYITKAVYYADPIVKTVAKITFTLWFVILFLGGLFFATTAGNYRKKEMGNEVKES